MNPQYPEVRTRGWIYRRLPVVLAPDNESAAMTHRISDVDSLMKQCLDIGMVKYCPKQTSSYMATLL
jgi:hypothetical protein